MVYLCQSYRKNKMAQFFVARGVVSDWYYCDNSAFIQRPAFITSFTVYEQCWSPPINNARVQGSSSSVKHKHSSSHAVLDLKDLKSTPQISELWLTTKIYYFSKTLTTEAKPMHTYFFV